jgi:hypothetical protein
MTTAPTIAERLKAAEADAISEMHTESGTSEETAAASGYLEGLADARRLVEEHTPRYTREVTIRPAFDCLEVRPCVKGSPDCGTRPGASHGRGTARMHLALYTPRTEVRLIVDTGWHHPATPEGPRTTNAGMNLMAEISELGYHSADPVPGGLGPVTNAEECPRGWSPCYSASQFGAAAEGTRLLIIEGTDAVWAWLEQQHRAMFGAEATGGTR